MVTARMMEMATPRAMALERRNRPSKTAAIRTRNGAKRKSIGLCRGYRIAWLSLLGTLVAAPNILLSRRRHSKRRCMRRGPSHDVDSSRKEVFRASGKAIGAWQTAAGSAYERGRSDSAAYADREGIVSARAVRRRYAGCASLWGHGAGGIMARSARGRLTGCGRGSSFSSMASATRKISARRKRLVAFDFG
jgi:hypothetical protein